MGSWFGSTPSGSRVTTHIVGADQAVEALKKLEFAARRRVVTSATRASNAVLVRAAREMSPVGKTGQLKKQIRGTVKFDRITGTVSGTIRSHATKKQSAKGIRTAARYAHLVIGGTRPHEITASGDGLKTPAGFYRRINHPGAKPRPFMEEAANQYFQQAINAFGFQLDVALSREVAKLRQAGQAKAALVAAVAERF